MRLQPPARARSARSGIRRHRPGRQTRMPDIMRLLADDPAADPLVGNYTLVKQDDVILAFQGLQNQYGMMAFTASNAGGSPTLSQTGSLLTGNNTPGKHLAAACGDFDGDGLDEVATVFNNAGELTLMLAKNQDPASSNSLSIVSQTPIAPFASGLVRVSTGNLTGTPQDTISIAWVDAGNALNVQVWHTDTSLTPSLVASGKPCTVTGPLWDLVGGSFDDSDASGLAIVWPAAADRDGNTLFLSICTLNTSNQLVTSAAAGIGVLGGNNACCVAAGPFLAGSTQEQIAVAWSDAKSCVNLRMCEGNGIKAPTLAGTAYVDTANPLTNSQIIRMAAGDLNLDGCDELVLGSVCQKNGYQAAVALRVFKTDNNLNPGTPSVGVAGVVNQAMASVDFQLAIGELGVGGFLGIVLASLGTAGALEPLEGISRIYVGLVPVSPTLQLPPPMVNGVAPPDSLLTYDQAHDPQLDLTLGLSLGDFSGQSLRVGPPKQTVLTAVNNITAIINAPPLQNGVNYDGGSTLSFSNSQNQNTSVGVTVNKDWITSDTLGVNVDLIAQMNASLTQSYGTNFSKTADANKSFTQTVSSTLWQDDLIFLAGTLYTIWEYPVYNDTSGTPKGYLMVVFPDVDGVQTLEYYGTSQFVDYFPDHQNGLLLSYASTPPADYTAGSSVNMPISLDIDTGQTTITVDWANSNTNSQSTTNTVTTSINGGISKTFNFLGGLNIGINAHFSDTYTQSTLNTYSVTYTQSTSVTLSYAPLMDRSAEYIVKPFIYFSNEGGFLVVDYLIEVTDTGYWARTGNAPNASFNQPWQSGQDPSMKDYTRSIQFVPQLQGPMQVTARVGNYSFVQTTDILVTFYLGDPANASSPVLGKASIPLLQPRARANVSIDWTPPSTPGTYQVYATLTPTGSSSFTASKGYNTWTVPPS